MAGQRQRARALEDRIDALEQKIDAVAEQVTALIMASKPARPAQRKSAEPAGDE